MNSVPIQPYEIRERNERATRVIEECKTQEKEARDNRLEELYPILQDHRAN